MSTHLGGNRRRLTLCALLLGLSVAAILLSTNDVTTASNSPAPPAVFQPQTFQKIPTPNDHDASVSSRSSDILKAQKSLKVPFGLNVQKTVKSAKLSQAGSADPRISDIVKASQYMNTSGDAKSLDNRKNPNSQKDSKLSVDSKSSDALKDSQAAVREEKRGDHNVSASDGKSTKF